MSVISIYFKKRIKSYERHHLKLVLCSGIFFSERRFNTHLLAKRMGLVIFLVAQIRYNYKTFEHLNAFSIFCFVKGTAVLPNFGNNCRFFLGYSLITLFRLAVISFVMKCKPWLNMGSRMVQFWPVHDKPFTIKKNQGRWIITEGCFHTKK